MTNLEFQKVLLDLMDQGYGLLTETERLSHQLLWRVRSSRRGAGTVGWEGPRCGTFNSWARSFWGELWPEEWPASELVRWQILSQCLTGNPPPEPFVSDIPLVLAADECFETCLRYGIDPGKGDPGNRLVEWRRSLWKVLQEQLSALRLFHPASLTEHLCRYFTLHPEAVPKKVAVVGFEFSGYWETNLFRMMADGAGGRLLPLPAVEAKPRTLVYADPEQEIFGLLNELTSWARQVPLHELAVVLLDSRGYAPLLAKHFHDVFGPPLTGDSSAYNLVSGDTLTEQPLFRAAVLPLDFCVQGEHREQFYNLIRSPYYGYPARCNRALAQWDWQWREKGIDGGLSALIEAVPEKDRAVLPRAGVEFQEGFAPLLQQTQSASSWMSNLRLFWKQMQFPVLANERDQIAWKWLDELIGRFEAEFDGGPIGAGEVLSWLRAAAGRLRIELSGHEDAGIQVIGGLELRGLAFSRVWVPGFLADVIPQPPRSLPFLSSRERKMVQGGDVESQYRFGRHLQAQIPASCDEVVLSRPLMTQGGDPCLPSPFWPAEDQKIVGSSIPWRHEMPALQRARWVVDGLGGFARRWERDSAMRECVGNGPARDGEGRGGFPSGLYRLKNLGFPGEISISALESLLCCPGRFFLDHILGLEPLPETLRGLDPPTRGRKIHELLLLFGRKMTADPRCFELPLDALLDMLGQCVTDAGENDASVRCWPVEMKRLIGSPDAGIPGLLTEWLREEHSNFLNGWRWIMLEAGFDGLSLHDCPVRLRGRLDRLDFHPEKGCVCWDYKTGNIPGRTQVTEDLKAPQLPAYLLAIRRGLLGEAVDACGPLAAGYIALKSVKHLKHSIVIEANEEVQALLSRWEDAAAEALNKALEGDMTPLWAGDSCDSSCPFDCLCGMMMFDPDRSPADPAVLE